MVEDWKFVILYTVYGSFCNCAFIIFIFAKGCTLDQESIYYSSFFFHYYIRIHMMTRTNDTQKQHERTILTTADEAQCTLNYSRLYDNDSLQITTILFYLGYLIDRVVSCLHLRHFLCVHILISFRSFEFQLLCSDWCRTFISLIILYPTHLIMNDTL